MHYTKFDLLKKIMYIIDKVMLNLFLFNIIN